MPRLFGCGESTLSRAPRRDGTKKPAYDVFKTAVAEVQGGSVDCAAVPGA